MSNSTPVTNGSYDLIIGPRPTAARHEMSILDCTLCGGKGKIFGLERDEECVCAKRIRIRDALPTDLRDVPMPTGSTLCPGPIYVDREGDLTKEDVWFTAPPNVARAHLRWAITCRLFHLYHAFQWSFSVTSDETLRSLFLTPANKFASKEEREETVPFDHHVRTPKLLIIRLGYMGHKNEAAAGILLTALKQRELLSLPTWVVDSPAVPYAKGHLAWSERAEQCLIGRYRRVVTSDTP
jgi:hypothetical protein